MYSYIITADNQRQPIETAVTYEGDCMHAVIAKEQIPSGAQYLDFLPDYFEGHEGESGYLAFPANFLVYFKGHENTLRTACTPVLYMFGGKKEDFCFVGIQRGAERYDSNIMADIKDGVYKLYPRYNLAGDLPYGDFRVDYYTLKGADADYSGMARKYREVRLKEDGVKPLAERAKTNPYLRYAVDAPYVRIRLGWKPVPSPIEEQTLENEPPVHVACDFERVGQVLDEFCAAGVREAEICLVGWNVGGHDGRYPDVLPVEPTMGGEEGLRALIKKAQAMGYQITCHTNSTDAYSIASCWDPNFLLRKKNGEAVVGGNWGGGKMYSTCTKATYQISLDMLDTVADLGYKGLHYIDVVAVVPPRKCYDPAHPMNCGEYTDYMHKIFRHATEKIGGICSEGSYDYMTDVLDYGLYTTPSWSQSAPFKDEIVPLWQIVYNGIVMQNPNSNTINAPIKGTKERLEVLEYAGRPTFYFYSKFVNKAGGNWMGENDITCDTPEERKQAAQYVKGMYDEYLLRRDLQYRFILRHDILAEGVRVLTYDNGTKIYVNYNQEAYEGEVRIPAESYLIVRDAVRV